jgi:uncharacterized protein YprB with RNaseH-like and TPR domain
MTLDPSRLRDRLRSIVSPQAKGTPGSDASAAISDCRRTAESRSLERILGGVWREHDGSRSFVVTRRFESDQPYGNLRIRQMADRFRNDGHGAALLAGVAAARAPFILFDLETTGLSGGAGTHAFLVGRGWFDDDDGFVTEQHLLTEFGSERTMLAQVSRELSGAGALVTFNGKSFDAPVLETRYLFHRAVSPCSGVPHIDVLHPARRFWGSTAGTGCSLASLERRLLGAHRTDDVPGFEVPSRFFHFVRTGDPQPLAAVLEHNRRDLLSLAGITAHLLRLIAQGGEAATDLQEALALGRLYDCAGDFLRAERAFAKAADMASTNRQPFTWRHDADSRTTHDRVRAEALRALALIARRQRRFPDAAEYWRQMLDVPGCPSHFVGEATEALAVHHEHRERDLTAARRFALLSLESGAGTGSARGDNLRHRLARIERKLVSERPLSLFLSWP